MPSREIPQVDQDFEAAIANRDFERATQLLDAGANINRPIYRIVNFDRDVVEESTSYLMNAASFGDIDTMRFLLANGADPNFASVYDNRTALHQAAVNRESGAVDLLLAHGADVHVTDRNNKRNALEYALGNVDPTIVRSLVAAGAHGSLRDIGFSIDGGQAARDVVRVLVDHGIDINRFDDWGRTPLMWAAEYAEVETVRFMIELGADVHRVAEENMNGVHSKDTALSLARKQKRHDVVALLQQHGARDVPGSGRSFLSRLWDALTD